MFISEEDKDSFLSVEEEMKQVGGLSEEVVGEEE
ncbi:hypothetical protein Tco_1468623, partial [Tanacetum coccineum]